MNREGVVRTIVVQMARPMPSSLISELFRGPDAAPGLVEEIDRLGMEVVGDLVLTKNIDVTYLALCILFTPLFPCPGARRQG